MIQSLIRCAAAAAVCASLVTAQQRSETYPVTTTNPALVGFVADVYGSNFNGFSLIGYQARVDTLPFGNGTIESVDSNGYKDLQYESGGFKFSVLPAPFAWGAWCAGIGGAIFEVKI
ncbi:MAG: hypothetical protein ACE37K_22350 [Planctomycetota bacterium]|jgi:hypothetical protein